jgi:hypothetical protein
MLNMLLTPFSQFPYSLQCQINVVKSTSIPASSNCSQCTEQDFCMIGQDINPALGNNTAGGTGAGSCQPALSSTGNASATHLAPVEQQAVGASKQQKVGSDSSEEERHNFALSKDGAKIVASNKEAKKTSAILDTDSDTFMKNECKAEKWFIIELSQV